MKWKKYLKQNPEKRREAWDVAMDYTEEFDLGHGTSLFTDLARQIAEQLDTLIAK